MDNKLCENKDQTLENKTLEDKEWMPDSHQPIVNKRCKEIINTSLSEYYNRTFLEIKEIIAPYTKYDTSIIENILKSIAKNYLDEGIRIRFLFTSNGYLIKIKYLNLRIAPMVFKLHVAIRIEQLIFGWIKWLEEYKEKFLHQTISFREVMGPYERYSEAQYTEILQLIIRNTSWHIKFKFNEKRIVLDFSLEEPSEEELSP
jgi:hypothetical protein